MFELEESKIKGYRILEYRRHYNYIPFGLYWIEDMRSTQLCCCCFAFQINVLKERETLLVRTFFLKFWYTSKVSDALVRRGTLYMSTKFNILGINFIVGRF